MPVEAQPVLFMCGRLMKYSALSVFLWLLGIVTIVGNLAVLMFHLKGNKSVGIQKVQGVLVSNLAVADLLMGIYMILLGGADIYFGETFYLKSEEWRSSYFCRGANFFVVLSCEASMFLLLVITFDRYHRCVYPFSVSHMKHKKCLFVMLIIWFLSISIALVSSSATATEKNFYGLTDVCIGLPFTTRSSDFSNEIKDLSTFYGQETLRTFTIEVSSNSKLSWYFSLVLFTGMNFIACILISIGYIAIFLAVKKSSKAADASPNLKRDLQMAFRMSVIVGTNFFSWIPVILMGVSSQFGVQIPLVLYAWTVVFILPINSSINPFLYTLAVLISDVINDFKRN